MAQGLKPALDLWKTAQDRRRWIDLITWYHTGDHRLRGALHPGHPEVLPKEKVRTKPGGNAGGVNPIAWGTYCPGYAKMAGKYGITLQPADCQGALLRRQVGRTAYHFLRVRLSTEPAGGLNKNAFVRRCSRTHRAAQLRSSPRVTEHVPEIQRYAHLLTGTPGDTIRSGALPDDALQARADVWPTIRAAGAMRDLTDYDVLDEMLVEDGALTDRYRVLVIFQGDFVEQSVLDGI